MIADVANLNNVDGVASLSQVNGVAICLGLAMINLSHANGAAEYGSSCVAKFNFGSMCI